MLRLAGLLPHLVGTVLYYAQYRKLFRTPHDDPPESWHLDLATPLLMAALTPAVALAHDQASSDQVNNLGLALGLSIAAIVVVLVVANFVGFYRLKSRIRIWSREFAKITYAHVLLVLGLAVLLANAAALLTLPTSP